MKSNKGITLTSLIIYIIVFCIVIGTVSTMSGYFTKNIDEVVISTDTSDQYTKLITYLSGDLNSINFNNIVVKEDVIDITFLDETQHIYLYDDEKIYFIEKNIDSKAKTIVICNNITDYRFIFDEESKILKLKISLDGITYNNNFSVKK